MSFAPVIIDQSKIYDLPGNSTILNLCFRESKVFIDKALDVRLDFGIDCLLFTAMRVETLSRLFAKPSLFYHILHQANVSALHADTKIGIRKK
jgi:hypothetical protein